jgi:hypothetical protein
MEIPSIWLERLAAWRGSKLGAEAFCIGKDFSVHSLRNWHGKQLEAERRAAPGKASVQLARVQVAAPRQRWLGGTTSTTGVAVEVGSLRVTLSRGSDQDTLAAVLEVIAPATEPPP